MPKVKLFLMQDILEELKEKIVDEHAKSAEVLKERIVRDHHRNFSIIKINSMAQGFGYAYMRSKIKIIKNYTKGVHLIVHSFVSDNNTDDPHKVFHYVSGGTKTRKTQKYTPMFFPENFPRSIPGRLRLKPAMFRGKTIVVPPDTKIKGIKPRNFYKKINKNTMNKNKPEKEGWYVNITIREKL